MERPMLKADVRNAVFETIAASLKAGGFQGSRRDMRFRRVVPGGAHEVVMTEADYRPLYRLNLFVAVRVDAIEAITLPFSRVVPDHWERSNTLQVGPAFFGGARRYEIRNESELLAAAAELGTLFETRMMPWLDSSTGLASIEQQINTPGEHPGLLSDLTTYAFAGLAAASLCGRQDLDTLVARYTTEMKERNFNDASERLVQLARHLGVPA
jgi:hypothetical protein